MSALGNFTERFDQAKIDALGGHVPTLQQAVSDEGIRQLSEAMTGIIERMVERAGIDLAELDEEATGRTEFGAQAVIARLLAGSPPPGTIHSALRDMWIDGFMIGVAWQQDRELPDPDPC